MKPGLDNEEQIQILSKYFLKGTKGGNPKQSDTLMPSGIGFVTKEHYAKPVRVAAHTNSDILPQTVMYSFQKLLR